MVSQRVGHDSVTEQQQNDHMRRKLEAKKKKNALVEVCLRYLHICRLVLPDHLIQSLCVFAFLSNSILCAIKGISDAVNVPLLISEMFFLATTTYHSVYI